MEKQKFITIIRKNHKFGDNHYVHGRISGIKLVVCEGYKSYANREIEEGIMHVMECTPEQYKRFSEIVERTYPGLCIFNYKGSK